MYAGACCRRRYAERHEECGGAYAIGHAESTVDHLGNKAGHYKEQEVAVELAEPVTAGVYDIFKEYNEEQQQKRCGHTDARIGRFPNRCLPGWGLNGCGNVFDGGILFQNDFDPLLSTE